MSVTLGCNSLKVEDDTVKVNVPDNDLAKLMYYLNCVSSVINYNQVTNKYTDYQNYNLLSQKEEKEVYALAILLNPKLLLDAKIFIILPGLLTRGFDNQFFKITDDRIGVHVNQEIVIGGRTVKVLKIMVCNQRWINRNYEQPLNKLLINANSCETINNSCENITKYNYVTGNNSSSGCRCSKCCVLTIIIIVVVLVGLSLIDKFVLKGKINKFIR